MPKWPWPNPRFGTRPRVVLLAEFARVPPRPAGLLRGVARELLRLVGDRQIQVLHGLDDEPPLRRQLAEISTATGPALAWGHSVIARAGRGSSARYATRLETRGPLDRSLPTLEVELELVDVPENNLSSLQPAIDGILGLAASSGLCTGAQVHISEIRPDWPTGVVQLPGFSPPAFVVEQGAGTSDTNVLASTVPSLAWMTLLSPIHLQRLGGESRFIEKASRWVWSPWTRRSLVRPCGRQHVIVELGPIVEDITSRDAILAVGGNDIRVDDHAATWFLRELVGAGLMRWQHSEIGKPTPRRQREREQLAHEARLNAAEDRAPEQGLNRPSSSASTNRATARDDLLLAPPDCFLHEPLAPTARERRQAARDYGDSVSAFVVADADGKADLPIWGRFLPNSPFLWDPIFVGSPHARSCAFAFQSHRHGYFAKIRPAGAGRSRVPDQFHCPRCRFARFRVLALFQHPDDLDADDPRTATRPQDFFTWLALHATCHSCRWTGYVADIECG